MQICTLDLPMSCLPTYRCDVDVRVKVQQVLVLVVVESVAADVPVLTAVPYQLGHDALALAKQATVKGKLL